MGVRFEVGGCRTASRMAARLYKGRFAVAYRVARRWLASRRAAMIRADAPITDHAVAQRLFQIGDEPNVGPMNCAEAKHIQREFPPCDAHL